MSKHGKTARLKHAKTLIEEAKAVRFPNIAAVTGESSPYSHAQPVKWSHDDDERENEFFRLLHTGILISEFAGAFWVLLSESECGCGNHFNVTVLYPPDVTPMVVTLDREIVYEKVRQTFAISHFRYVPHDDIEQKALFVERHYPEYAKQAEDYANRSFRMMP